MSDLMRAVDDYLTVRRALGFKLPGYRRDLADFVAYLQAAGAPTVTTELALAWAKLPGADAHPAYLSRRLSVVRGFARHWQAFDPATEVPPAQLLPHRSCRAVPYLYSAADVAGLMTAARSLTPTLRAARYETLIGSLLVTGARIGELIRLDRDDIDWAEGVLVVRESKSKSRELPLHSSTLDALDTYARLRDKLCAPSRRVSSSPRRAPGWFTSPSKTRSPGSPDSLGYSPARRNAGPCFMTPGTFSLLCARVAIPRASGHTDRHPPPSSLLVAAFQAPSGPSAHALALTGTKCNTNATAHGECGQKTHVRLRCSPGLVPGRGQCQGPTAVAFHLIREWMVTTRV